MNEPGIYLEPLILTILFECTAAWLLKIQSKKDLILIILANIITNPLLVWFSLFLMYHVGVEIGMTITYCLLEPSVILIEYLIYSRYLETRINPLFLSALLNVISIFGGYLWKRIF